MNKIYSLGITVLLLMYSNFGFSQMTSLGPAPEGLRLPPSISNTNPLYANNRGFVYLSLTTHQLASQWMGNTTLTNIGTPQTFGYPAAFAYKDGIVYVADQLAPTIFTIDTTTGVKTLITGITGITLTYLTGFTWDGSQWWGVQSNLISSQIGTVNIETGAFTPVGSPTTVCAGAIMINASPCGTLYSVDITGDKLFRWNKTTGVPVLIGSLGVNANYAQDGHFDMSDGKYYWATYTTGPELRIIDTTSGASTLVGTYPVQVSALAVVSQYGPVIIHTPLTNTQNIAGPYIINSSISPSGIATLTGAKVFWSRNNPTITDSVPMTNSGSNYSCNIPGNGTNATYRYYIKASQNNGRTSQTNIYTFQAIATDTTKPEITHIPIGPIPKGMWPVAVTAGISDPFGIDSAWVVWSKSNTPSVVKRFRILNTTGNIYSALFNSLNSDVQPGIYISYRIFAQDGSAQHNRDSSAMQSIYINYDILACTGTDTISSNYPFTTFWMDGRTQILLTASELAAGGLTPLSHILKIGFNILTVSSQPMNGFNIRFQSTIQSTLTGFVTTGTWFTAYSGTYTVPGTGMQYIDLTPPYFYLSGTNNLIIEICFDNIAYTEYSTVASTPAVGMTWGYYTDNSSGCTMTGGTVQANRPNICFLASNVMSVNPSGNEIPKEYSLSQNYPNPFNPQTRISFGVVKSGFVNLKVYDALGREVANVVNENLKAGNYEVTFRGDNLASGMYFYKLSVNDFTETKKMLMVK